MPRKTHELNTTAKVTAALDEAYTDLMTGTEWDLSDREWWNVRLKLLELAAKRADDSDILQQVRALEDRVDAVAKPRAIPTASKPLRRAG